MKILGRDPTLWIATICSLVMIVGTLGLRFISGPQAAVIVVVINALFAAANAWTVRPMSPVVFTYAVGSIVSLFAAYGLNIPNETVAAINAAIIPALALVSRNQVSPIPTPITKGSNSDEPTTAAKPYLSAFRGNP